jgi:hypothetical protein
VAGGGAWRNEISHAIPVMPEIVPFRLDAAEDLGTVKSPKEDFKIQRSSFPLF